jgi:enterochelin esterase-like enzyme
MAGLYNTGVRRISEYTPTRDRRCARAARPNATRMMLAREIKPFIDHDLSHAQVGERRGRAGGSSLGALVSLVAGLDYPRVFGKLALMSPSVWWDDHSIAILSSGLAPRKSSKYL